MAAVHEQMAACLRSQQSMAACRAEMLSLCERRMGDRCPMMGAGPGGMGPGMRGHGPMHGPGAMGGGQPDAGGAD
jgi:hypothetical protein